MTHAARLGRGRALRLPQPERRAAVGRRYTRRQVLDLGRRAAFAAALASQARLLSACSGTPEPSEAAWRDLASRLSGTVLRPRDPGYRAAALPHNLRYASILPAGIARCVSTEDVATSILWARENGIDLVARAGGHSYAGFSCTRGLQIDVGAMSGASVDPSAGVVAVEAGALNAHVSEALEPFGLLMSQGRCPSVGISGLTLGGGFGFSSRKVGLTCDALLETTLVTASGDVLTCSERENQDLFWACRGGGGGSFGINTSYRFALDVAEDVSVYELEWASAEAAVVFAALGEMIATGPDELSLRVGMVVTPRTRAEGPVVTALGQYFGPSSEVRELLAPVYAAATPRREVIADLTFYEAKDFLSLDAPPAAFGERSVYTAGPLADAGIDTLLDALSRWPGSEGAGYVSTFAWGGAINRVPVGATAVVHRDTLLLMALGTEWHPGTPADLVDADLAWLDGMWSAVQPYVQPRSYQNFSDPALQDWERAYYGEAFERLVSVKTQVDPDDVFRFAQSIPVRSASSATARHAA